MARPLTSSSSSSLDSRNPFFADEVSNVEELAGTEILNDRTSTPIETTTPVDEHLECQNEKQDQHSLPPLLQKVVDKVGKIDESRIVSTPEYLSGDVPKLFSNLNYETIRQHDEYGNDIETVTVVRAIPSDATFLSSSALLCGTALGCGLLTLPTAVGSGAGYIPTLVATLVAWGYMTVSALLTSELLINRCGETGRVRNVGLLELYTSYLGETGGKLAGLGFLVVSYVVMGVYLSEGGDQLMRLLDASDVGVLGSGVMMDTAANGGGGVAGGGQFLAPLSDVSMSSATVGDLSSILDKHSFLSRTLFAGVMGSLLSTASKFNTVQKAMTHFFFPATLVAFVVAVAIGLPTADFSALLAPENQHPEAVLNAFPLLFMGWTYHGVVPRVVYDLEGDKDRITKAIVVGSTMALVVYLVWNAVILGNVLGNYGVDVGYAADSLVVDAGTAAASLVGTIEESSAVVLGDMLGPGVDGVTSRAAAVAAAASLDTPYLKPLLQSSVAIVSELAVITSLIGVVLGFVNEFNDATLNAATVTGTPSYGPKEDNKWKVALLTLLPPAVISISLGYFYYDINNYEIIDYTGIFGSSVLFLILPALMAWQNRYAEDDPRPLTVRPMVPLGKVVLGSLYKAAGTLILEQGLEKLGVFQFVKDHLNF